MKAAFDEDETELKAGARRARESGSEFRSTTSQSAENMGDQIEKYVTGSVPGCLDVRALSGRVKMYPSAWGGALF